MGTQHPTTHHLCLGPFPARQRQLGTLAPAASPLPAPAVLCCIGELPAALPAGACVGEGALRAHTATLKSVILTNFTLSLGVEERWLIRIN